MRRRRITTSRSSCGSGRSYARRGAEWSRRATATRSVSDVRVPGRHEVLHVLLRERRVAEDEEVVPAVAVLVGRPVVAARDERAAVDHAVLLVELLREEARAREPDELDPCSTVPEGL